jgi:hypothetical protein
MPFPGSVVPGARALGPSCPEVPLFRARLRGADEIPTPPRLNMATGRSGCPGSGHRCGGCPPCALLHDSGERENGGPATPKTGAQARRPRRQRARPAAAPSGRNHHPNGEGTEGREGEADLPGRYRMGPGVSGRHSGRTYSRQ